jgi:protein-tyrosine phosphatase
MTRMMTRAAALASLPLVAMLAAPAALAGTITDPVVERLAPDRLVVRWNDKEPVDVLQSDRPDADVPAATLVSDQDRDGSHEVTSAPGAARPYFLLRDHRSGEVVRVAERVLPLEQGSNFRDIGGYPAAGGKHVRWGMIYRSGGQPLLTDADVKAVQGLGIANLVDLRSDEERVLAPTRIDGIPYSAVGYSMATMMASMPKVGSGAASPMQGLGNAYRGFPTQLAPQIRLVFRKLLAKEGPVAYNCSAGQDRTGFTTGLILSVLGVPRDTIYADYTLSTTYRRPQWELPPISDAMATTNPVAGFFARFQKDPVLSKPQPLVAPDGTPFLAYAFSEIDGRWGSVDAYLQQEIGLSAIDIASLRATYLE